MKDVIVHGSLAILGLVFAYTTWTREDDSEKPKGDVEIFNCEAGDLRSLTFETDRKVVRLEPRELDGEDYFWFKSEDKAAAPNAKNPQAKPPAGGQKPEFFVGNDAAKTFVEKITPLRALRSLGEPTKDSLKDFELDKSKTQLSLDCGSRKATYTIGGSTFGVGDRYIRSKAGGPVYLLSAELVRDIEGANFRFMQRALQTFQLDAVDRIMVTNGEGKTAELVHRNRREPAKAEWVEAQATGKRNELYGNWLTRVDQLRVESFLKPGERPGTDIKGAAAPEPVLKLEYRGEGRKLGQLELVRVKNGADTRYYAKSDTTHLWTVVVNSTAKQIDDELPGIYGAKIEKPSATPPRPAAQMPGHPAISGGGPASSPAATGKPTTPVRPAPSVRPAVPAKPTTPATKPAAGAVQ